MQCHRDNTCAPLATYREMPATVRRIPLVTEHEPTCMNGRVRLQPEPFAGDLRLRWGRLFFLLEPDLSDAIQDRRRKSH